MCLSSELTPSLLMCRLNRVELYDDSELQNRNVIKGSGCGTFEGNIQYFMEQPEEKKRAVHVVVRHIHF
jgi:hypothetical protein